MKKKTLVFGASLDRARYSYFAIQKLVQLGHEVKAFGERRGEAFGVLIGSELKPYSDIDTITLYMNAKNQKTFYKYLVGLNPKRIIFNPGAENPEFYKILDENHIQYEVACTLVLLSTNQY
ncbi:CoA-binding protein [Geojedonia litorea]|uniref:CoA-binding protein n=1 Tax=Geojedonia litorea TaxID=1268269 RepID=A0ABV9N0Z2_9FLAO